MNVVDRAGFNGASRSWHQNTLSTAPDVVNIGDVPFSSPKGRETKLKAIRRMLGCPEDDAQAFQQDRDKFSGDSDFDASQGYPCPVCGQGRMVRGEERPRPTVRQILAIPFIIWTAIASDGVQQQREQRQQAKQAGQREDRQPASRERQEAVLCSPTQLPADELRQQLLPLAFW